MSPASLPLPLDPAYIGATWEQVFRLYDGSVNTPLDLTGRTVTMALERKGLPAASISVTASFGADTGVAVFTVDEAVTALWTRGNYAVEVRMTDGSDLLPIVVGVLPILKGAAADGTDTAGTRQDGGAIGLIVSGTGVVQTVLAPSGLNGRSAYQVAVADGYGGTEEEYAQGPIDAAAAAAAATAQTALALTATTNATSAATSANTAASAANTAADAADDAAAYALASGRVVATVADLADIVSPSIGDGARVVADALGDVTDGNGEWTWTGSAWDWIAPLANPTAQGHFDMVEGGLYESVTIGLPTTPITGTSASIGTCVFNAPVEAAGRIYGYWLWALTTGTVKVRRFTKSGDVFTMVAGSERTITVSATGLNEGTFAGGYYVDAGDYIGFYNSGSARLVYGADHGTGCFYSGSDITTNFTDSTATFVGVMIGFHLYQPAVDTARMEAVEAEVAHPLTVVRASPELYVRGPFSETHDIVERFRAGITPSVTQAGVCEPGYSRLIPVATTQSGTVTAYNASTTYLGNGGDDASPVWINELALGGNHGMTSWSITATAHGKTNVDVGSRWTDTASKVWVIARIPDANTLVIVPVLGGTAAVWTRDMTLTGTTLTHSAGATNTGAITHSSPVSAQLYPWVQNHAYEIWLDGKTEVTADGTYTADYVQVNEQYGIPNAKSVIEDLIARVGSASEPQFNRSSIQTQAEVDIIYGFRPGELMKVDYQLRAVQAWDSASVQGVQASARYFTGTDKLTMLVPETVTEATTGLDFSTPRNITSNASLIEFAPAEWADPAKPPARVAQIVTTSADVPTVGFLMGFSPRYGAGVPATRLPLVPTFAIQVSTSEKMYPRAVQGVSVTEGQVVSLSAYRGSYDAAGCGCTVNAVYTDGDKKVWVLDVHETLTGEWIALPVWLRTRMVGKRLTVFDKSSSATLHSAFVGARGAQISVTGAKGWLIIEIG